MKKIIGVIAVLLTLLMFQIYRQLTHAHTAIRRTVPSVPEVFEETLLLSAMLIQ